ncbi:hypothetical protein BN174_4080001 [Clostridioides difficile E15]|nr:hypothetical protein BN174_4080001 [Clostridioides difficile E15]
MYVKDLTEEICLEAVKQDGLALRYIKWFKLLNKRTTELYLLDKRRLSKLYMILNKIKNRILNKQIKEICLEAVKQNGKALQYVKDQTEEMCLIAVRQDNRNVKYVKNLTNKVLKESNLDT